MPFGIGNIAGLALGGLGALQGMRGGNGGNPADAAQGHFNQIPGMARQYLEPYANAGQGGLNEARGAYNQQHNLFRDLPDIYGQEFPQEFGQMGRSPVDFLNRIQQSYRPSEGYNYKEKRMLQGARNSAAQGGFSGTQADQENQAGMIQGMLGQDMQEYLNNVLGIQGTGLEGLERQLQGKQQAQQFRAAGQGTALQNSGGLGKDIYQNGYAAAGDIANILGSNMGQQGNYAYNGQRQQMQNRDNRRQNIGDMLMSLGGGFMGAGGGGGMGGGGNPFQARPRYNPNGGGW
jgi:hypothetical protein